MSTPDGTVGQRLTATTEDHTFTCLLGDVPDDVAEEVVEFWLAHGALQDRDEAERRTSELAWVARSPKGELEAVCTVTSMPFGPDKHPHWNLRAFTRPGLRELGLAGNLVGLARKVLARNHREDDPERGLLIIAQNPALLTPRGRQTFRYWSWELQGRTPQGFDVWRLPWERVDPDLAERGITTGPEWDT